MQVTFNEQDVKNPETREMLLTLLGASLPVAREVEIGANGRVVGEFAVSVNVDTKRATADVEKLADAARETVRVLNHAAEVGQSLAAAPAPAAPPAPAQPATETPAATAGSDMFDNDGYPWDARIHSETRNKNQDGTWRIRRGVDKELVDAVRLEFKNGAANAAELTDTPVAPPAPSAPAAPAFGGELPQGAQPIDAPAAPSAPAAPAPDANAWPTAILGEPSQDKGAVQLFMEYAMNLIQEGRIQSAKVLEIAQGEGLKTLVGVGTFPEKIPTLVAKIQQAIGA